MLPIQRAVIVLQATGFTLNSLLLLALLLLPVHSHPIVIAVLSASLAHSFVLLLPTFWLDRLLATPWLIVRPQDLPMARICASSALMSHYISAIRASFSLSLSLAVFHLTYQATTHDRDKEYTSDRWIKYFSLSLCFGPPILALPILIYPIPSLVKHVGHKPISYFFVIWCGLTDVRVYLYVVGIYCLALLVISFGFALTTAILIVRFYIRHRELISYNIPNQDRALVIRFALGNLMVFVTTFMLLWQVVRPSPVGFNIASCWLSVTPICEFLIFSTREAVWRGLLNYLQKLFCRNACYHDRTAIRMQCLRRRSSLTLDAPPPISSSSQLIHGDSTSPPEPALTRPEPAHPLVYVLRREDLL